MMTKQIGQIINILVSVVLIIAVLVYIGVMTKEEAIGLKDRAVNVGKAITTTKEEKPVQVEKNFYERSFDKFTAMIGNIIERFAQTLGTGVGIALVIILLTKMGTWKQIKTQVWK